jgi:mannose-6-phosphate isomerase-like protein (cupin superfamily)
MSSGARTRSIHHDGLEDDRPIGFIGDVFTIRATSFATGGACSSTELIASPKAEGPPTRHHDDCEEAFYVASRPLDFEVDGQPVSAPAGSFVVFPRGAQHVSCNPLVEGCTVLLMIST